MSIFTSRVTKDLTVPFGDGGSITIRKLNQKQLQQALIANFKEQIRLQEELYGADEIKRQRDAAESKPAETPKPDPEPAPEDKDKKPEPLGVFHKPTLMLKAVVKWSFDEKPSLEVMADMDDDPAAWLCNEILKMSRPQLFLTANELEAQQKNG